MIDWKIVEILGDVRYHRVEKQAFAKLLRTNGNERLFVEVANELISSIFAKQLQIPLAEVFLDCLPEKGVALFSKWAGKEILQGGIDYRDTISNYNKFKDLFVFDQWTYNYDRQHRHIVLQDDPVNIGKKIFTAIDNGHSLNDYNGQKLQTNASLLLTPSQTYFDSGFVNTLEIKPVVEIIERIKDEEIEKVVSDTTNEILKWNPTQNELTQTKNNEDSIKRILKERRNNLRQIIESWCRNNGKIIQWI